MKWFGEPGLLRRKVFYLLVSELAFLLAIGVTVSYQINLVHQKVTEIADLKDPSPFAASLIGFVNKINLYAASYVQNRDLQTLQPLAEAEKEFENSLGVFQKQNSRLFPIASQMKILEAYEPFKDAVVDLLTAQAMQSKKWESLLTKDDEIVFLLERHLRPLVRMGQRMAVARLDLILNLENHVRGVPKDLTRYLLKRAAEVEPSMRGSEQRFNTLLRLYERLITLPKEREELDRLSSLLDENVSLAEEILRMEKGKQNAFSQLIRTNQTLQGTISTALPAVRPEVIQDKKAAIFHSIMLIVFFASLVVLIGIVSALFSGLWIYRRLRRSVKHISDVAEAAVTGDLSRQVTSQDAKELGGMAQSVNRLIKVLRRSERLIYQLGSLVESSGDAVVGMNLRGTILSWNHNAERMYGYSAEEVQGKSIAMLFANEAQVHLILGRLSQGKQTTLDTVHLRKSGVNIQAHLIVNRILNSTGEVIGISMLSRALPPLPELPSPTHPPYKAHT